MTRFTLSFLLLTGNMVIHHSVFWGLLFTRKNKSEELSHKFSRATHHLWGKAEIVPEYMHPKKKQSASFLLMHLDAVHILKLEAQICKYEDSKPKPSHSPHVGFMLLNRIKGMYLGMWIYTHRVQRKSSFLSFHVSDFWIHF